MTTIRAAIATIAAMTPAASAFARRMEAFQAAVAEQALMFPTCMAAEYAQLEAGHPAYVESVYAAQAEAWARVDALGGRLASKAHTFPCECPLCIAVSDAYEADKEVRKGVWYHYPLQCECATCAPITPPVPPPAADLPTRWEVMGTQGEDF